MFMKNNSVLSTFLLPSHTVIPMHIALNTTQNKNADFGIVNNKKVYFCTTQHLESMSCCSHNGQKAQIEKLLSNLIPIVEQKEAVRLIRFITVSKNTPENCASLYSIF